MKNLLLGIITALALLLAFALVVGCQVTVSKVPAEQPAVQPTQWNAPPVKSEYDYWR